MVVGWTGGVGWTGCGVDGWWGGRVVEGRSCIVRLCCRPVECTNATTYVHTAFRPWFRLPPPSLVPSLLSIFARGHGTHGTGYLCGTTTNQRDGPTTSHAQHTPRRVTHAVRAPPPPQSPPRRPSRLYACSAALSLSQRQRPPRRPCSDPRARPLLTLSRPVLSRSPGQAMPEARDAHTCTPASSPITHTRTRTPVPTALTRRRAYTAAPMRRDSSQTLDLRDARRTHG